MSTRRDALRALGALGGLPLLGAAAPAAAQFRVEIAGVGATQLPIALAPFRGEDGAPQPVSAIVRADLERSGRFQGLERGSMLERPTTAAEVNAAVQAAKDAFPAWAGLPGHVRLIERLSTRLLQLLLKLFHSLSASRVFRHGLKARNLLFK